MHINNNLNKIATFNEQKKKLEKNKKKMLSGLN